MAAYVQGLLEVGKPKPGETVVVSAAAGAVGSLVVQIAKIVGCRVVALAGNQEKLDWLKNDLGADVVINYKDHSTLPSMLSALKEACPNGIDIYFDNTGGVTTDAVFHLINLRARIIICGQITQYEGALDNPEMGPRLLHFILYKVRQ
jgi:NADPH-dependent curcumin reductase CurA